MARSVGSTDKRAQLMATSLSICCAEAECASSYPQIQFSRLGVQKELQRLGSVALGVALGVTQYGNWR